MTHEDCSCADITNISLYSCISTVVVTYVACGLYALWKLRRHRKVGYLPLLFLIAGIFTAALTCSVTSVVQAHILCMMTLDHSLSFGSGAGFALLGIVEAVLLLGIAVSHSYFNI